MATVSSVVFNGNTCNNVYYKGTKIFDTPKTISGYLPYTTKKDDDVIFAKYYKYTQYDLSGDDETENDAIIIVPVEYMDKSIAELQEILPSAYYSNGYSSDDYTGNMYIRKFHSINQYENKTFSIPNGYSFTTNGGATSSQSGTNITFSHNDAVLDEWKAVLDFDFTIDVLYIYCGDSYIIGFNNYYYYIARYTGHTQETFSAGANRLIKILKGEENYYYAYKYKKAGVKVSDSDTKKISGSYFTTFMENYIDYNNSLSGGEYTAPNVDYILTYYLNNISY